ncbi:hypothetical protein Tco_0890223 [Tanacetum coccineum]|uniref:Uncharacterized protein n=1 Tax=Tanacetum coccineum TaxID=301880 RepID=A0ABQ5BZH3_9ASTR
MNGKVVMSVMLGVKEPENVQLQNPNVSKVKGSGCFSRMKPIAKVTAEELSKRRTCSVCGDKGGHNSRTYKKEPHMRSLFRAIPSSLLAVLRMDPSALGVSSIAGLIFLRRSCVLVPLMVLLDDTKGRHNHLRSRTDMDEVVDDEGKPLKKVDYSSDHDSEDEVEPVDKEMTSFLASERVDYNTNSLLEQ